MELWSLVTSQTNVSRLLFSENEWNREWIPCLFMTLKADISKTKRDFSKITSKPCSEGQILSLEINLWKHCSWPLKGAVFTCVIDSQSLIKVCDSATLQGNWRKVKWPKISASSPNFGKPRSTGNGSWNRTSDGLSVHRKAACLIEICEYLQHWSQSS